MTDLTVTARAATADDTRALGERLAAILRPGDLVIATGDLGAGKTTFTQGLGAGMGVTGPVISPTFVISRIHPCPSGGPALVHVDAYRLASFAEVEDLDLEESMARSVTLVEWGEDVAEGLAPERLELAILRSPDPQDETRLLILTAVGGRWSEDDLRTWAGERLAEDA